MSAAVKVSCGSFALATYVSGQPEGAPWIVLSNSLGASAQMWEPQLPLLETRYRVLRYDTRGHGQSEAPKGPYMMEHLVGDVLTLCDHYHIQHTDFMGLSLGGMTGLGLALHHADRFGKIICCDARADNPPAFIKSWDDRMAAIDAGGLQAIVHATMERWFVEEWRKAHPQALQDFVDVFLQTSPEGYKACAQGLKHLDYFKDLGSIQVPMLYVVGDQDMGAPPEVMRAMAQATPSAGLIVIPHAAHLPNIDHREAFNQAIAGFLDIA